MLEELQAAAPSLSWPHHAWMSLELSWKVPVSSSLKLALLQAKSLTGERQMSHLLSFFL